MNITLHHQSDLPVFSLLKKKKSKGYKIFWLEPNADLKLIGQLPINKIR